MLKVKDYIDNNENTKIRICGKETTSDIDPFCVTLWEGMSYDVPEKLMGYDVLNEGWLLDAQINSLEIFIKDWAHVWDLREELQAV